MTDTSMTERQKLTCETSGMMHRLGMMRRILLQKATRNTGLYFGQLRVLEYIAHNDGCTQVKAAKELLVTPASMAQTAKRLENAGFITRRADEGNLRCNRLSVTPKGLAIIKKCGEVHRGFDKQSFEGLSEQEILEMKGLLGRMICNITGESYPPVEGQVTIAELERLLRRHMENAAEAQKNSAGETAPLKHPGETGAGGTRPAGGKEEPNQ